MLGDKMGGARMRAHAEHRAGEQKDERLDAQKLQNEQVKRELHEQIDDFQVAGDFWIDEQRPDRVEKRLQRDPKRLSRRRIEETSLKVRRQISIQARFC